MPVREFVDAAGVPWRVWNTTPSSRVALTLGYEDGWLTFEADGILRRLKPVPPGWDELADAELERLCRSAGPVTRRFRHGGAQSNEAASRAWWHDRADADGRRSGQG